MKGDAGSETEYDLKIYGLVDYATGDGLTLEPGDWQRGVDLDAQPWTSAFGEGIAVGGDWRW